MDKKSRKIWIDTDAGTDDAMAIIMAIRDPNIEIVGISTCGGNVPLDNVVQNVLYLIEKCNSDIPVYVGARQPLERVLDTADFIHGADGLGDIGLPLQGRVAQDISAIAALKNAISKYGPELEIVNLGPLTNLASLIKSVEGPLDFKHCYIMGGLLDLPGNVTPLAEYNIWADPEAAEIVFQSGMKMTVAGWDTTLSGGWLSIEEWHQIDSIRTPIASVIHDMQQVRMDWQMENESDPRLTWADPCTMAIVLNEAIIEDMAYVDMHVMRGTDDDPNRGFIKAQPNTEGIRYIKKINREMYKKMIWDSLSQ